MIRVDIDSLILHRAEQIRRAENILPPGAQDRSISGKGDRAVWCGAIGQAVFERAMEEYGVAFGTDAVITHDYRVPAGRLEVKTKERWSSRGQTTRAAPTPITRLGSGPTGLPLSRSSLRLGTTRRRRRR